MNKKRKIVLISLYKVYQMWMELKLCSSLLGVDENKKEYEFSYSFNFKLLLNKDLNLGPPD